MRIPRHSTVVAYLALGVALGGSAYAATSINGRSLKNRSVAGVKLKRNTLGGSEINERRLGKVPRSSRADVAGRATTATTATNATNATTATNANNATNATTLAGQLPSAFEQRIEWAYIEPNGTILRQSGGISLTSHATGDYILNIPSSTTDASLVTTPSFNQTTAGRIDVEASPCGGNSRDQSVCPGVNDDHHVHVGTADSFASTSGNQDEGFYIAVIH